MAAKKTLRVNGAKIFGARPGAPFLFKVPVSGARSGVSFGAEGLPEGLSLDAKTGIIEGSASKPGSYDVKLRAKSGDAKASSVLRIVIGDSICLTPPMGWNSWYCHSESVSDDAVRKAARDIVAKGLDKHGWTYVNIDDCWQGLRGGPLNAIQPNERFPDMKGMCDYVHSLGLKAGIYSTPWQGSYAGFLGGSMPEGGYKEGDFLPEGKRLQVHQVFGRHPSSRERGMHRVGEQWLCDADAKQWAAWGFDYVKYDWFPNDPPTTKRLLKGLSECGRDIALSLSNAAPIADAAKLLKMANCIRSTGDIYDTWESISKIALAQAEWSSLSSQGHWIDPDMLQLGNIGTPNAKNESFRPTRLSKDEQIFQMSFWCLLSAPLLLTCDIESLDEFTLSLLTNDEVIAIDQDALGANAKLVANVGDCQVWTKPLFGGATALGFFNFGDKPDKPEVKFEALGIEGKRNVRDLWKGAGLGRVDGRLKAEVPAHGAAMFKID